MSAASLVEMGRNETGTQFVFFPLTGGSRLGEVHDFDGVRVCCYSSCHDGRVTILAVVRVTTAFPAETKTETSIDARRRDQRWKGTPGRKVTIYYNITIIKRRLHI